MIETFIRNYQQDIQLYRNTMEFVENQLKNSLKTKGVIAIVSSRLKDENSLREKLKNRNKDKKYQNIASITQDIHDLIGIRIALYFPSDVTDIKGIVDDLFVLNDTKQFPSHNNDHENLHYTNRFDGYCATHFRIFIKHSDLNKVMKNCEVEIQVASLLMHAWAEVEHDLVYKLKKGNLSLDEYETLDELNGLVIAGEISLMRLKRYFDLRVNSGNSKFDNHYQLSYYIKNELEDKNITKKDIGNIEILFNYLKSIDRLTPIKIKNDIKNINNYNVSISKNILIKNSNKAIKNNLKNIMDINDTKYAKELGTFLETWLQLEMIIENSIDNNVFETNISKNTRIKMFFNNNVKINGALNTYNNLKKIRNDIVHGRYKPSLKELINFTNQILNLIKLIKQ